MGAAACTATGEICLGIYTMLIAMVTESLMKCRHYVQRCLCFPASLTLTLSFPPNPGAFMDGLIARRPSVSQQLEWTPKALGSLGQRGPVPSGVWLQHWILQSCSDPPVTGAPEPPKGAWPLQGVVGSPSAVSEGHSCGERSPRLNSKHASCLRRDAGCYSHGVGGPELSLMVGCLPGAERGF